MDDFKYPAAPAPPDAHHIEPARSAESLRAAETLPDAEVPALASDQPAVNPAVVKFKSCRWKATPEQGDFCTHRDVLPFAGKEGFKPDSWCPECAFYKLRRTPKKRERIDYSY
jgi:hypothetical protein